MLASCSSGPDLRSERPFRLRCTQNDIQGYVLLVNPLLSKVTTYDPESRTIYLTSYEFAVKTPFRFEFRYELNGVERAFSINRFTGGITIGLKGDLKPLPDDTKCQFESLKRPLLHVFR